MQVVLQEYPVLGTLHKYQAGISCTQPQDELALGGKFKDIYELKFQICIRLLVTFISKDSNLD